MNQINLANKYDGRSKMEDIDDDIVFGENKNKFLESVQTT
jgi:hypothetical protein